MNWKKWKEEALVSKRARLACFELQHFCPGSDNTGWYGFVIGCLSRRVESDSPSWTCIKKRRNCPRGTYHLWVSVESFLQGRGSICHQSSRSRAGDLVEGPLSLSICVLQNLQSMRKRSVILSHPAPYNTVANPFSLYLKSVRVLDIKGWKHLADGPRKVTDSLGGTMTLSSGSRVELQLNSRYKVFRRASSWTASYKLHYRLLCCLLQWTNKLVSVKPLMTSSIRSLTIKIKELKVI